VRLRPDVHTKPPVRSWFISAAATPPFAVWEYLAGHPVMVDGETVGAVLSSTFFTSSLAFVTWNRGLDLIGAPRASTCLLTIPLCGLRHVLVG